MKLMRRARARQPWRQKTGAKIVCLQETKGNIRKLNVPFPYEERFPKIKYTIKWEK